MARLRSGKDEGLLYSLSRWTDLPAAKWPWFEERLDAGWFLGIDPRTALPAKWSLKPEDSLGLVFWTREPSNLIRSAGRLKGHQLVIHMTMTGWHEVEKGAPNLARSLFLLELAVDKFGPESLVWRFSPIPLVEDVVERFSRLAAGAEKLGLKEVFVAFLQDNDYMTEPRTLEARQGLLRQLASSTKLQVRLCNEDRTLAGATGPDNLGFGICEGGQRFQLSQSLPTEGCGCALAVDPFTINESCIFGCSYCYAADEALAPRKRNTTKRHLPVA